MAFSPGRRYGLSSDTCASFTPHKQPTSLEFDLNLPPINTQSDPTHTTQPNPSAPDVPNSDKQRNHFNLLQRLSETNWAQGSLRIINGFCVPFGPLNRERSQPSPPSESVIRPENGSLASLVAQGWALQAPGPMEAGPSNWMDRNLSDLEININNEAAERSPPSPPELRSISNMINNRFRISPPIFAYVFNPLL